LAKTFQLGYLIDRTFHSFRQLRLKDNTPLA
jgi:hypothetical protein